MDGTFEPIAHAADTGIRAEASDLAGLFTAAANGMLALMYTPPSDEPPLQSIDVSAVGATMEDLMVNWLSEVLARAEIAHLALGRVRVDRVTDRSVSGTADGWDAESIELVGPPIKAVTYHLLEVAPGPEGWEAVVIFDV